jgi:vacuolar protein sorting-associated protein 51
MASTQASSNVRSSQREDDDNDSDDDGDEFLTLGSSAKGGVDREALVRKKLLENFYGKSAVAAAIDPWQGAARSDDDDDDSDDNNYGGSRRRGSRDDDDGDADDLDSPSFDVEAHTRRHVWTSSVHTLLETEEQLALQVRTLDSTMQTLVYENYSKFIDATDAIRSIGVNVNANQDGLNRLVHDMEGATLKARQIEDELGSLRDQVAEKIRIKRLLTRLDSLLNLPNTLRQHIGEGKYKPAAKSYLSAVSILSKHSEGFESLRTIEAECISIVEQLKIDLRRKLLHWSGRNLLVTSYDSEGLDGDGDLHLSSPASDNVQPPSRLSSIFECSGALLMLLGETRSVEPEGAASYEGETGENMLNVDDLQSMALSASMRWLDRLLDGHLIQVQERRFAPLMDPHSAHAAMDSIMGGSTTSFGSFNNSLPTKEETGSALIPAQFLPGVLEAVTLFRSSCVDGSLGDSTSLVEFVSEAFATFLAHVRAVLLEESAGALDDDEGSDAPSLARDKDAAHQDVSSALSLLVSSVKDFAGRLLAIEGSGWKPDKAQQLVDRVMSLTESMVRRRVDQTFSKLRLTVVETCLLPLVERVVEARSTEEADDAAKGESLQSFVQLGGSALSDCLQLVDDTIRTIFSTSGGSSGAADGSNGTANLPILKHAVEGSANRFAAWLASTLEVLAGGESSDPQVLMEAPMDGKADFGPASNAFEKDGDWTSENQAVLDRIDQARAVLLRDVRRGADFEVDADAAEEENETIDSELVLGLAEVCRLAQGSVAESVEQSIRTHTGSGAQKKKQPRGLFPSSTAPAGTSASSDETLLRRSSQSAAGGSGSAMQTSDISRSFQMACSRLVALFAVRRGTHMADALIRNLAETLAQEELSFPPGPSEGAYRALQVAKETCLDCAALYGGSARAGPVPIMESNRGGAAGTVSSISSVLSSSSATRKASLLLDVERVFKERVVVYPHPQEPFEASRNSILFLAFKVALRSLVEHVRLVANATLPGFRQLQIDVEFVRHMVPHYVSKDYVSSAQGSAAGSSGALPALSGLLDDATSCAGDKLPGGGVQGGAAGGAAAYRPDEILEESRRAVRIALDGIEDDSDIADTFILQEDV